MTGIRRFPETPSASHGNRPVCLPGLRLSRRSFLTLVGGSGLVLALHPIADREVWAQDRTVPPLIEIPGAGPPLYTQEWQDIIRGGWGPLTVAGLALNQFNWMYQSTLRLFDPSVRWGDLSPDARKLLTYYRTAGGQGIWRSLPEARALYQKVPASIRVSGIAGLKEFHANKVWSHIFPRALGGADTAQNGIWWSASKNLELGKRPMTWPHLFHARYLLISNWLWYYMYLAIAPLVTASMVGIVITGVLAIFEFALSYYMGEITRLDLIQGVFSAVLAAGTGSFMMIGLVMGVALAFPVLLPLLEAVTISLAVVSFVFLINHLVELGQDWWAALDEQGHLDQFLAQLRILEEFLSDLSQGRTGRVRRFFQDTREKWSDLLARIVPDVDFVDLVPEFDYARYFPDWNWELSDFMDAVGKSVAQVVPDEFTERFATLNVNVGEILAELDLPSLDNLDLPVPDFGQSTRSAQEALVSASAYLKARGASAPSGTTG